MGDILGGMNLVIGVLMAVNARNMTGVGQRIDVSLVDSVVASLENAYIRYFKSGELPVRNGNAYASIAPYDTYRAKDGRVIIACGNQKLYDVEDGRCRYPLCQHLLHDLIHRILHGPLFDILLLDLIVGHPQRHIQEPFVGDHPRHIQHFVTKSLIQLLVAAGDDDPSVLRPAYGPYSQRPGYDIISQGMGGLMSVTGAKGGEPTRSGNAMGDSPCLLLRLCLRLRHPPPELSDA